MTDFVTRRAYFEDYGDTVEELPPSLVQYGMRFTCADCGYPTLRDRAPGATCTLCRAGDEPAKREVVAAFDQMQSTPTREHEPLWARVRAGMDRLGGIR